MWKTIKIYKSNIELFGKYIICFDTLVNCFKRRLKTTLMALIFYCCFSSYLRVYGR